MLPVVDAIFLTRFVLVRVEYVKNIFFPLSVFYFEFFVCAWTVLMPGLIYCKPLSESAF